MMLAQIVALVKKDLLIEWRQRYALNGILLHVVAAVFVVYLAVKNLSPPAWNAVFWLMMLFTSVNAVAKSFIAEAKGRSLYYYGIATAESVILSRILYNMMLMLLIASISLTAYMTVLGSPVAHKGLYLLCTLLGCMGFAGVFTLMSAIASKAGNSNLLMPVLSFPVIIPLLLVLIKASKKAMDGIDATLIWPDVFVMAGLNLIIIALAYLLFPFLWKD